MQTQAGVPVLHMYGDEEINLLAQYPVDVADGFFRLNNVFSVWLKFEIFFVIEPRFIQSLQPAPSQSLRASRSSPVARSSAARFSGSDLLACKRGLIRSIAIFESLAKGPSGKTSRYFPYS